MQHVLWLMWMAYPNQADSLQGFCSVNCTILAANDPGIGSGWQQSKQNWALAAVVGQRIRMASTGLYSVEAAPLLPVLLLFPLSSKSTFLASCLGHMVKRYTSDLAVGLLGLSVHWGDAVL